MGQLARRHCCLNKIAHGFLQAVANFMQGVHLFGFEIPVQVFNSLPYVMTIVLLAGFIGKSTPPKADGVPYTKDR